MATDLMELYPLPRARAYCAWLGMPFDEDGALNAMVMAMQHQLSADLLDEAVLMHAERVKFLFSPNSYDWKTRLALAWHFLANPKGW